MVLEVPLELNVLLTTETIPAKMDRCCFLGESRVYVAVGTIFTGSCCWFTSDRLSIGLGVDRSTTAAVAALVYRPGLPI